MLTLQPNEAVGKAKAIFTAISNNNIRLFCEIGKKNDAVINSFYEEKSKVIPHEMHFELESIHMNIENKGENLQPILNKLKEAIRIYPNDSDAYYCIGTILKNEKRYEEAVKNFNDAIRINPNWAIYYSNKGDALYELNKMKSDNSRIQ